MRYARLHHKSGESLQLGELLECSPLGAALFQLSLARADLYGILPGEARAYRVHVCPAASLPAKAVESAIAHQERVGLVKRYVDARGTVLLHILGYHNYQEVRWANGVGAPENDLPEWWEAPAALVAWLRSDGCKHPEAWTNRGVKCGSAPVELPEEDPPDGGMPEPAPVELAEHYGSATVELPESDGSAVGELLYTDTYTENDSRENARASKPAPSSEDEAIQMASGIPAAYIMQARLECLPALKERLGGTPEWGQSAAGERKWLQCLANEVKIGEVTFAELRSLIEDPEAGPRTPDAMKPGDWLRKAYAIKYKRSLEAKQTPTVVIGGIIPAGREPPAIERPDTSGHDAYFANLEKVINEREAAEKKEAEAAHG